MGAADDNLRLERLLFLLVSTPAQKFALDTLVEAQQDPASPDYHRWLSPDEFGSRFGADRQDLARITAWLRAHGFMIDEISAGKRLIEFSGTAGQVFDTFHTEVHRYQIGGAMHIANAQDPQVPEALADRAGGIVSLQDFGLEAQSRTRRATNLAPEYSAGETHYLFPADFAAIYDLNPVYADGIRGSEAPIAIAGRSNIEQSDVASFRSIAGLPVKAPVVIIDGTDPGLVADDQFESTLAVEWSGAVAPAATIDLVVAGSTATTDGVDLAAEYIVNHRIAPIVSVSYSRCEREMGATERAFYNDLWEQAASEGISVFVASGDAGAAGCSAAASIVGTEAAVNGLCSSPYATCVGGTEFDEGANPAQFWSTKNSAGYGSALGYVPEAVWNESAADGGSDLWASGGGKSTVYAQPSWQSQVNGAMASDGMRGVPDVALAAAEHDGSFAVINGAPQTVSGTSVAAPEFSGLMALVISRQHGAAQGNANPRLYSLAESDQSPFHPTQSGDNSVPGVTGFAASGATYNLATGLGSVDGALLVSGWGTDPLVLQTPKRPIRCSRSELPPHECKPAPPTARTIGSGR